MLNHEKETEDKLELGKSFTQSRVTQMLIYTIMQWRELLCSSENMKLFNGLYALPHVYM